MNNILTRKRKGLSPMLATVILIGVTVAAGGATYAIYTGSSSTASSSNSIQVESITAVKGSNHADFTATVKNGGTSPWKTVELWIAGEAGSRPILYEDLHEIACGDGSVAADKATCEGELDENGLKADAIARFSDGSAVALGRKFLVSTEEAPTSRTVTVYQNAAIADLKTFDGKYKGSSAGCVADSSADLNGWQCKVYTGLKIAQPVAPGQTIRLYADLLLPGHLLSTQDTPLEILGVTPGNNPAGNPVTELHVGDELAVNIRAVTMDGQEVQTQTLVRIIGA